MNYTGKELAAVVRMAVTMANADGVIAAEERSVIVQELANFGVSPTDAAHILIISRDMDPSDALATIACMNDEQKRYVTGYLAVVMIADGKIDDSEVKMWRLISMLANLPSMDLAEALNFWNTH